MVKITYKGETRDIPKRYLPDTLSATDKRKQIKSIFEKTNRPKVDVKKKRSKWTISFDTEYGKAKGTSHSMSAISKTTGYKLSGLKTIKKKGEGAFYSSGSRPNQSATSWALGRTYAYIMGGKAVRKIDNNITKKYSVKFKIKTKT